MVRAFRFVWLGVWALALASLSHCLAPTEIVVWLSTDVACSVVGPQGYSIAVGDPATVETQSPVTVVNGCSSDGGLGSIVIVPSGSDQAKVGIRVVLGVDTTPDKCDLDSGYTGCIVARRELPYSPHEPLTLPVELLSVCKSVGCGVGSTCNDGTCVDASTPCTGGSCDLPDAGGGMPDALADAGCSPLNALITIPNITPSQARPRVAKTPTGWMVAYATQTDVRIVPVTTAGADLTKMVTIVPSGGWPPTYLGPVASDGTTYAVTYTAGSVFVLQIVSLTGTILKGVSISTASTPLEGLYYQPSPGFYFTAAPDSNGVGLDLLEATSTDAGVAELDKLSGAPGGAAIDKNPSINPAEYWITSLSGTTACYLQYCNWTGTNYTCLQGNPSTPVGCNDAKIASNGSTLFEAYENSAKSLGAVFVGTAAAYIVGPLDATGAYKPLALGSTPFRLFWQAGGVVQGAVYSASTASAPDVHIALTGAGTSPFMAFDVAADDPAVSASWSVAYYSNGAVMFAHECQ